MFITPTSEMLVTQKSPQDEKTTFLLIAHME